MEALIHSLHPLERQVLKHLAACSSVSELEQASGLQQVEVIRALQWLSHKDVVHLEKVTQEVIELGKNGRAALQDGLPERRFLEALKEGPQPLEEVAKTARLHGPEVHVCVGLLKRRQYIDFKDKTATLTAQGKAQLDTQTLEERFLHTLADHAVAVDQLNEEERFVYEEFKKRKDLITVKKRATFVYTLTNLGKRLAKADIPELIDKLTSDLLAQRTWKGKPFRHYDVEMPVPPVHGGKRHFAKQATEYARRIWLEMGFQEMQGPLLQTSFWNFDALFTAQDHPVREMQDTFFIEQPASGTLPDKRIVQRVKAMHEHGGETPSSGWEGTWQETAAQQNVLRTHTTVLSAQILARLKASDLPAKFFSVGRCFRNETLDWSHLFEFNQAEGIVVDPEASFPHLLGYLQAFFKKMGFDHVRFRPAYFPYTEPSVEIDVYHPEHQTWLELGGAGVLRPEVVVPLLGEDVPVLAWGPGLDRMLCDYYEITDIRDLYKNDLQQIRDMKVWNK